MLTREERIEAGIKVAAFFLYRSIYLETLRLHYPRTMQAESVKLLARDVHNFHTVSGVTLRFKQNRLYQNESSRLLMQRIKRKEAGELALAEFSRTSPLIPIYLEMFRANPVPGYSMTRRQMILSAKRILEANS
jgi:hypothetical protein